MYRKNGKQSVGIAKDRKMVVLNNPCVNGDLPIGITGKGIPVYLINSAGQLWPECTGLAGQIFIYMILDRRIIFAEEICGRDGYGELVKDMGCRIEDFAGTDVESIKQEWKFAKVIGEA